MKVYCESEWIGIYDKENGGRSIVTGIVVGLDKNVKYVNLTTDLTPTLSRWMELYADDVNVPGKRQFSVSDGEVVLVADPDENLSFSPTIPGKLENPHVIPFKKWLKDWIFHINSTTKREEDKIYDVSIEGCELSRSGIIKSIDATVTWYHIYGPFGRLKTKKSIELSRDILCGTYGMSRDSILDDWTPNCCGDHGYRAFFTKDLDVVWADDGRYSSPKDERYYKIVEKVKWNP